MQFLEIELKDIQSNLALDDVLLERADQSDSSSEILRIWEPETMAVVLGRSSRVADEVDLNRAIDLRVPVLRRSSGGASVVIGPGCLIYTLVLSYTLRPALRMIDQAHQFVMQRTSLALAHLDRRITMLGTSDLAVENRKFSGNSIRCGRNSMLYHGTILVDMELEWIARLLKHPPREPDYRQHRSHALFVDNLHVNRPEVVRLLRDAWQCTETIQFIPPVALNRIAEEKYRNAEWNFLR